jgi:hypothetical protein
MMASRGAPFSGISRFLVSFFAVLDLKHALARAAFDVAHLV